MTSHNPKPQTGSIIALDVGEKRVGVAMASLIAKLPSPLTTLEHDKHICEQIKKLLATHQVQTIVVGLPRNLSGSATAQTKATEEFAAMLKAEFSVPVYMQDEAVTSRQAEAELKSRGKPYSKKDIDSLSATYILEDFLNEQVNL